MIAGAQFRGQFEKRFKEALNEAVESEGRIVLFLDELHTVLGAGAPEGAHGRRQHPQAAARAR